MVHCTSPGGRSQHPFRGGDQLHGYPSANPALLRIVGPIGITFQDTIAGNTIKAIRRKHGLLLLGARLGGWLSLQRAGRGGAGLEAPREGAARRGGAGVSRGNKFNCVFCSFSEFQNQSVRCLRNTALAQGPSRQSELVLLLEFTTYLHSNCL